MAQAGGDAIACVLESDQFRAAFDADAEAGQTFDQQALVFVLREDVQEGIRGQAGADVLERDAGCLLYTSRCV